MSNISISISVSILSHNTGVPFPQTELRDSNDTTVSSVSPVGPGLFREVVSLRPRPPIFGRPYGGFPFPYIHLGLPLRW